jgi:hypothetical protein
MKDFSRHTFNSNIVLNFSHYGLIWIFLQTLTLLLREQPFVNTEWLINNCVNFGCPQIICVSWKITNYLRKPNYFVTRTYLYLLVCSNALQTIANNQIFLNTLRNENMAAILLLKVFFYWYEC